MSNLTQITPPANAPVRCTGCGQTMAADQRYCLECGRRKGDPRVEFNDYMKDGIPEGEGPPPIPPTGLPAAAPFPVDPRPVREVTPLMAAAGLAAFAVILLLGVVVGQLGGSDSQTPVVAATGLPATATATTESSGGTGTDVTVSFKADWPSGTDGFTIELATVSKDSADGAFVETTKTDLAAQGASEVGALDSDEYASLPGGNYVFYSGVYDTKADAEKALGDLSGSFPDAQVIEVSTTAIAGDGGDSGGDGGGNALITDDPAAEANPDEVVKASEEDLKAINDADAEDFQELQDKLPPTIETEGEAPPPDNKAPGGGGNAVDIG